MKHFLNRMFSKARTKAAAGPKVYKYNIMVPDGSGTIAHTDDEEAAKLASRGFYVREDGKVACITCGGNCGQCGNTGRLGNIGFSMDHMTKQLHAASNQHIVWERRK